MTEQTGTAAAPCLLQEVFFNFDILDDFAALPACSPDPSEAMLPNLFSPLPLQLELPSSGDVVPGQELPPLERDGEAEAEMRLALLVSDNDLVLPNSAWTNRVATLSLSKGDKRTLAAMRRRALTRVYSERSRHRVAAKQQAVVHDLQAQIRSLLEELARVRSENEHLRRRSNHLAPAG
jgi:hypothetical protein